MATLESSQRLHEMYGEQKMEKCFKDFPYKWKHTYLHLSIIFRIRVESESMTRLVTTLIFTMLT